MALDVALIAALIVLNAAFAGTEMALVSLREWQLRRLEREGARGRRIAALARDPNRSLAAIQVGITVAGFLASATAAVGLAEPLVGTLDFLGSAAEATAIVVVTAVLSFFSLVVGELVPKRIAMQRAERWALIAASPLAGVAQVARPVVWLLARSTELMVRALGGDARRRGEGVTAEELRELVAEQQAFSRQQRGIIGGALEAAERSLRDVLIPRRDVVALPAAMPAAEARARLSARAHSRAPVYESDLDDAGAVVHLRDLVDFAGLVAERARPALVLPESVGVLRALRVMQGERHSLALVISEYGVFEGIVSVEDLVEELVGEIFDETDRDLQAAQRLPDGSWLLVGSFPIHDLVDLGVDLPEGDDYTTVAGLVLDRLGHLPRAGESLAIDGWRIIVLSIEGHAIARVRVSPVANAPSRP
jgi:putative hemolysin